LSSINANQVHPMTLAYLLNVNEEMTVRPHQLQRLAAAERCSGQVP